MGSQAHCGSLRLREFILFTFHIGENDRQSCTPFISNSNRPSGNVRRYTSCRIFPKGRRHLPHVVLLSSCSPQAHADRRRLPGAVCSRARPGGPHTRPSVVPSGRPYILSIQIDLLKCPGTGPPPRVSSAHNDALGQNRIPIQRLLSHCRGRLAGMLGLAGHTEPTRADGGGISRLSGERGVGIPCPKLYKGSRAP